MKLTLNDFTKRIKNLGWEVRELQLNTLIEIKKDTKEGKCIILVSEENNEIRYKELTSDEPETYSIRSFSSLLTLLKPI